MAGRHARDVCSLQCYDWSQVAVMKPYMIFHCMN